MSNIFAVAFAMLLFIIGIAIGTSAVPPPVKSINSSPQGRKMPGPTNNWLCYSPDGRIVAHCYRSREASWISLYDGITYKKLFDTKVALSWTSQRGDCAMCINQSNTLLAIANAGHIHIYDIKQDCKQIGQFGDYAGDALLVFDTDRDSLLLFAATMPDGLVLGSYSIKSRSVDIKNRIRRDNARLVTWLPHKQLAAITIVSDLDSKATRVEIIKSTTGEMLAVHEHLGDRVSCGSFFDDGKSLALGLYDGSLFIMRGEAFSVGKKIVLSRFMLSSMANSDKMKGLLIGSFDRMDNDNMYILYYNLDDKIDKMHADTGGVHSVSPSPLGDIATIGEDVLIRIWKMK